MSNKTDMIALNDACNLAKERGDKFNYRVFSKALSQFFRDAPYRYAAAKARIYLGEEVK